MAYITPPDGSPRGAAVIGRMLPGAVEAIPTVAVAVGAGADGRDAVPAAVEPTALARTGAESDESASVVACEPGSWTNPPPMGRIRPPAVAAGWERADRGAGAAVGLGKAIGATWRDSLSRRPSAASSSSLKRLRPGRSKSEPSAPPPAPIAIANGTMALGTSIDGPATSSKRSASGANARFGRLRRAMTPPRCDVNDAWVKR